jgi:spermidine synthase
LDLRYLLVLACFFVSGFAGLLYETAWTREFSFVFGTSNLAVATVLAAYMGGLSLGAAVAARLMHRIRRPVLVYGLLELGIATSALAVPYLIRGVTLLYRPLFLNTGILPEEGGLASALFYGAAAFGILGIPTTLMGATLPMLARHAVREESQIGGRIGTLYSVNTAGAVVGTIATAFLLLPELGLRLTVWVGAALNVVVFLAAALLARGAHSLPAELRPTRARDAEVQTALVLAVAFTSSVASFTYENVWFRLFEHVLGASIYAFSTMLAGFLIGIALGGALAAPRARTQRGSARGLAFTQIGAAFFSFVAFTLLDYLPDLALKVNQPGLLGVLTRASVAAALLLPSTLCIGASFPFAVRALAEDVAAAAATSARVYSWNTLGAIVGSVSAGFFVIPGLGFERTLIATVLLNLFAAALAAFATRPLPRRVLALAAACALGLLIVRPSTPWAVISNSTLVLDMSPNKKGAAIDPAKILYFGVGRSSTVLLYEEAQGWRLRNNGLPEAMIEKPGAAPRNSLTGRWLAMLPAFAPAAPRDLLVIGLGGGVAVEYVPQTFEHIDVIELEPEVLEANRRVAKLRNRDPLADPRIRVWLNDARGALMQTDLRYGAIVSQPSHPWTAGASHLYTRDFFAQVKDRLAPGGVFVQWMGLQFVDESLLRSLIATLLDVFPHVRLYQADRGSILFVSSLAPLDLENQVDAVVALDPGGYARAGVRVKEDLAAALVLDEAGARKLSEGAPIVTDDHNLFATDSPRVLARPIGDVRNVDRLFGPYDPLVGRTEGLDLAYLCRRLLQMQRLPRAQRIAEHIDNPLERTLAQLEIAVGRHEPRKAAALAARALAIDPRSSWALYHTQATRAARAPAMDGDVLGLLREGQRLLAARDWEALERLDGRLGSVDLRHPAHPDAQRLRIDWRLGRGTETDSAEALRLIDLEPFGGNELLARRALAGVQSTRPGVAGQSLALLASQLTPKVEPLTPLAAEWALTALDGTPADELSESAGKLRPRLVKMRDRPSTS